MDQRINALKETISLTGITELLHIAFISMAHTKKIVDFVVKVYIWNQCYILFFESNSITCSCYEIKQNHVTFMPWPSYAMRSTSVHVLLILLDSFIIHLSYLNHWNNSATSGSHLTVKWMSTTDPAVKVIMMMTWMVFACSIASLAKCGHW